MAQKRTSIPNKKPKKSIRKQSVGFFKNRQTQTILGSFLILFAFFLMVAFISFFFSWQEDQSTLTECGDRAISTKNLLGKIGAKLSHFFVYKGFGLGAFIIPFLLFLTGLHWFFHSRVKRIISSWNWGLLGMLWLAISLGFVNKKYTLLSGVIGFEVNQFLQSFLGKTGLIIVLFFFLIAYLVVRFKITPEKIVEKFKSKKKEIITDITDDFSSGKEVPTHKVEDKSEKSDFELSIENLKPTISKHSDVTTTKEEKNIPLEVEKELEPILKPASEPKPEEVEIAVEKIAEEKSVTENLSDKLVKDFGEFDPTLELGNYSFPTFNLLKQYNETISVDPEELEANKNKIVETLKNYKIGIAKIKATVGPTITLYEIVPEAGVRISKIKNLEDDIALSLSALGIRIIAPIPGKGTIGIEVPNKKSTIVSMHSVISSKKFQESPMELPIALGKTISNETFVVDLAKMPHLLMAGATGQGKSVGLNAV